MGIKGSGWMFWLFTWCLEVHELALLLIGFSAGAAGAVAGVNSLVSFPGLLLLGYSPLVANVTNTVGGLVPGVLGASLSYRSQVEVGRRRLVVLTAISAAGGFVGGLLLQWLGARVFELIVPALLVVGAVLILLQPFIVKRLAAAGEHGNHSRVAAQSTFVIAIYAGYFGSGAGILLVAVFATLLSGGLQQANGLKSICALASNLTASVYFAVAAPVDWTVAACLAPSTFLGAVTGAHIAKRLPDGVLRITLAVGGVGAALTALQ